MYKCFKLSTLKAHNYNKGDLAQAMGLNKIKGNYDTALPRDWIKQFDNLEGAVTSNLIYSTTFWVYDRKNELFDMPVCGCFEVKQFLEGLNNV